MASSQSICRFIIAPQRLNITSAYTLCRQTSTNPVVARQGSEVTYRYACCAGYTGAYPNCHRTLGNISCL